MSISIGHRKIGREYPPFIIAEMSGNHNQSLERALDIVEAAADSGADAIKLQTYTADSLTLDIKGGNFEINDPNSLWHGKNLYELYQSAYTPWEWHQPIMRRARELGLICFSSPFDESAVRFLEELDAPAFKIASFENNHLPLIKRAAVSGRPLIISTGMASIAELDQAVNTARKAGCNDLILLKCTSTYPASPEDTNVRTIPHMSDLFRCQVGLSDHTLGVGVAVGAVALGATVIEKHFTLSRADGGVDSAFSLEPHEFKTLALETKRAWQSLGVISYGPTQAEEKSLRYRRSIYAACDISSGDIFTTKNLKIIRPAGGASPCLFDSLVGKVSTRDFRQGDPVSLDTLFKENNRD